MLLFKTKKQHKGNFKKQKKKEKEKKLNIEKEM